MSSWLGAVLVLMRREVEQTRTGVLLVVTAAAAVEVSLAALPWSQEPEPAVLLYQLTLMSASVAAGALLAGRQAEDLLVERARHFLSFPVTPAQALLAKLGVAAFSGWAVLLVANGLWSFLYRGAGALSLGACPRTAMDQTLWLLIFWGLVVLLKRIPSALAPALFAMLLWFKGDFAAPTRLVLQEADRTDLHPARLVAVLVVLGLVLAVERHVALRPVE